MEAKGGVIVTQKDQTVTGDLGVFDVKANTATVTGNVVMTQCESVPPGEELVVDIGVDVVRIPLAQIKNRTISKISDVPAPKGNEESLYLTGELPHRSVKALAEKFGEGRVWIRTPWGVGRGVRLGGRGPR